MYAFMCEDIYAAVSAKTANAKWDSSWLSEYLKEELKLWDLYEEASLR